MDEWGVPMWRWVGIHRFRCGSHEGICTLLSMCVMKSKTGVHPLVI